MYKRYKQSIHWRRNADGQKNIKHTNEDGNQWEFLYNSRGNINVSKQFGKQFVII